MRCWKMKRKRNRCVFLSIRILIGSVVSGIIVLLFVKYGGVLAYEGYSCFWTEWTDWKGCNNLLTSVMDRRVQIYTGYARNCLQKERYETRICKDRTLNITFDPTTLRSDRYLSVDHTILSNSFTDRTPYNPKATSRSFQRYLGAMVNACIENMTSIYFEIYFKYYVISILKDSNLILELGLGERNNIDNYYDVGNSNVSGWAFQLRNCKNNNVCLKARHEPHDIDVDVIKLFSNNTSGTNANGTFGILIDRERNTFSLFYNETVLFTFHDVLSNVSLCPVFGVFNHEKVEVALQIVSVGNMTLTD